MSDGKKVHEGRNIKRFREMMGLKQEAFAWEMGEEWSQKRVSLLEQKESVDEAILKQVAEVLKVPVEAIKNFDEENAVNIIANTFDNGSILNGINHNPTFFPVDKIMQLHEEKMTLYERMLKEKDEMMEMLKGLVESLKA
ncbi:MAG: transcriptional regulator [Cytophagaceae bacterium SCN 52-12]|nr:MAG: transcriptional regulator [Cytophagaceae bacterium SCN 52-12]